MSNRACGLLAAGLEVGLTCLAAGISMGVVTKAFLPKIVDEPRLNCSMVLILIFIEALGLYGLVMAQFTYMSAVNPKL